VDKTRRYSASIYLCVSVCESKPDLGDTEGISFVRNRGAHLVSPGLKGGATKRVRMCAPMNRKAEWEGPH